MDEAPKKPGWLSWVLGPLLWVAGVAIAFGIGFFAISGIGENAVRMLAPGTREIACDEPGTYTIFHEYESDFGGKVYSQAKGSVDLRCTVTRKDDGQPVSVHHPAHVTYNYGSREGVSVWAFTVDTAGPYVVTVESDEEAVVMIDKGLLGSALGAAGGVCAGVGIAGLAFVAGSVILIVTIVRRVRYAKSAQASAPSTGAA